MKLHSMIDVITNSSSSVYVWPKEDSVKIVKQFFAGFLEKLNLPTSVLNGVTFETSLDTAGLNDESDAFYNNIQNYDKVEEFLDDYAEYENFFKKYSITLEDVINDEKLADKYTEYVLEEFKNGSFDSGVFSRNGIFNIVFPDGTKIELTREINQWFNIEELSWY